MIVLRVLEPNSNLLRSAAHDQRGISRLVIFALSIFIIATLFLFRAATLSLPNSYQSSIDEIIKDCENDRCYEIGERILEREEWFSRHGIQWEKGIYLAISKQILTLSLPIIGVEEEDPRSLLKIMTTLSVDGLLRISFFLIASSRIWIASALLGFAWAVYLLWPLKGRSIIGELSNSISLFSPNITFSIDAHRLGHEDERLLVGLMRPEMVSMREAKKHKIAQILKEYDALTVTALQLLRIILKNPKLGAWVQISSPGERVECEESQSVEDAALAAVTAALRVHLDLQGEENHGYSEQAPEKFLRQVIVGELRVGVAAFDPASIAVAVLSIFAGRSIGGSGNGAGEPKRISLLFRSARGALLGVKEWSVEFAPDLREVITQGLLRAEGLTREISRCYEVRNESAALAQWLAVLGVAGTKRKAISNKVEILALLHVAATNWLNLVAGCSISLDPDLLDNSSVTDDGLIVMPLPALTHLFRRAVSSQLISRLHELLAASSEREMGMMNLPVGPLTEEGCQALSGLHSLSVGDLKTWSIARVVLATAGWLVRDTKNGIIPSHGLVCVGQWDPQTGVHSPVVVTGSVVIRGQPLVGHIGERWFDRFKASQAVYFGATLKSVQMHIEKRVAELKDGESSSGRRNVS